MKTICITGANRGLGLELARQYLENGFRVIATCRLPESADELKKLQQKHDEHLLIHALDVCSQHSITQFAQTVDTPIDILINNAGIPAGTRGQFNFPPVDALSVEQTENMISRWQQVLHTNTIAPLMLSMALLKNLEKGKEKKIVIISSRMGSIEDNDTGKSYLYRSSKAAVNAVAKSLSLDMAEKGICVGLLHPGWVKTDMGGTDADISAQVSVTGMRVVIEELNCNTPIKLYRYDGGILPW